MFNPMFGIAVECYYGDGNLSFHREFRSGDIWSIGDLE